MQTPGKNNLRKKEKKVFIKSKRKRKRDSERDSDVDNSRDETQNDPILNTVTLEEAFEMTKGNQFSTFFHAVIFSFSYSSSALFTYVLPFLGKYPAFS